jgi:HNH endonuclease
VAQRGTRGCAKHFHRHHHGAQRASAANPPVIYDAEMGRQWLEHNLGGRAMTLAAVLRPWPSEEMEAWARFRCELCGISATEKALEPDHIIPRNHGGTDDLANLQALCYSCNAMKRDRDDTDFRSIRESYQYRKRGCLFCEIEGQRILAENELAYSIADGYPVSPPHTLLIPKRHLATFFLSLDKPKSMHAQDHFVSGFQYRREQWRDGGTND